MIKWMVMMILSENIENRFAHRASGVEDLEHALLAVDLDLLPVGVLDGGVVLLHEDALHKLHCQGGLSHTTRTQHHDLVFSHLWNVCILMIIASINLSINYTNTLVTYERGSAIYLLCAKKVLG